MGDIDEMRIDVTADSTADTAKKYQKISTFNRVSEYVTLDDGRVAYAYVDGYDTTRPFRLALISADGSKEEFTLIESDTRGYVGLCQLSDGTLAASVSNKADTAVLFCKFDLTQNKVTARLEQSVRRMQRLYSTDDGFYSIDNSGKNAAKIYFIDNDFTAINEVFAELADEYNYSNYNKFIVGNNVLYISRLVDKLNNSNTERYSNKYSFALYDRDNNKLSECIAPGFDDDRAMFLGADINNKGEIFVAYYDLKQKQLFIMVFDENMNKLRVASPDFPTQSFNSIYTEGIFKCVDDGYFFSYQYIRQYNPKGLVGMFTTETYKQGWLMDSNFNVKSVFDVSYNATAALLGTEGNRFVVGDEYGYYTVNAELTAQEENITLSSDRYVVDNEAQTITGVAEKTTVEELLKFIRSSSENCRYEFVYTHVALDEPISQSQELSCNYQLIVYNSDGSIGKVYTFPQLPQDFESTFKITSGGWLYNYTATDEVLVVPDFVKNISDDANDFSVVKSLTTSARVCLKGGIIGNSKGLPRLETVCLDGAQAIGYYGFSYCHNLKKVVIPDTVTKLEQGAFSCCSELEEITIPASVVEIAPYALSSLSDPNLKITYLGSREQWEQIDFGGYNWEDNYGSRMVFAGSGVYETAPAFRFSAASLTLQDNLQINYKVKKELFEKWGYVKPYVEFIFGADIFYVSDYVVSGDYYVFNFSDIAPNKLNDTIYATLYATKRGTLYSSETKEYSVATYCYNMLSQYNTEQYASFRTLLVDLLNYGASSQQYTGYKSGILANASLTEEQAGWGTIGTIELNSVMNKAYEVIDSPSVIWSGAGLNLKDSVTMRFKISAESLDGLYVKVKSESGEWKINSKYFEETDGGYYVYFSALNAGQMSESVYLTAYKGDVAVSNTICYSIESYAYSKQNDADSKLVKLLNDMMKYGRSANVYSKQGG